ncbi:unnamed protein product [Sphagnum tenellum]
MADASDCSSSGLGKGPNVVGEVTHFLSAAPSFRNRDLQNDASTSSTGEHTYYSTAPQELWAELLPKDLQSQKNLSNTQDNEPEFCFEEVQFLRQSDLTLLWFIAQGGQAHVYSAECEKFSTPVVVKRLKHGNVDLFRLQRRMEMLMKIRKKNNSAICRVFGVGTDFEGNAWVVMERMAGDLRTLIDRRMGYLEDGQMPFEYNNAIRMMMHIAQGMEDLHRCDLIHADLKASNILVAPMIMDPEGGKVDGQEQTLESMYFHVKIGDFESSDGVVGTRFWRAPEVLQAVKNETKPIILSPAADVYSYGMLCYELLTGRIPFEECRWGDYDVVLSGLRAFTVWQFLKKELAVKSYLSKIFLDEMDNFAYRSPRGNWWEMLRVRLSFPVSLYEEIISAEMNLKVQNATRPEETIGSVRAWKAVEVEKVTIRSLFLENTIDIASDERFVQSHAIAFLC